MSVGPPATEPTFLLKASDDAALGAIQQYLRKAAALQAPQSYLTAMQSLVDQWLAWRDANPTAIQVPTG
jgi:hypothetical protein